jgi:hypothetical protein
MEQLIIVSKDGLLLMGMGPRHLLGIPLMSGFKDAYLSKIKTRQVIA